MATNELSAPVNRRFRLSARGLQNAAGAAQRIVKTLVAGQPAILPSEQIEARRQICQKCDRRAGIQCLECECIIRGKTMLVTEDCPLGRWPAIELEEQADEQQEEEMK
jgi:hypothetical protein